MPYPTMTVDEIAALPVASLMERHAHLYLWTTNRFLDGAFDVVRAWGFRYSTTLVWCKAPIGAGLGGAYGIATEYLIYARRGSPEDLGRVGRNWFTWKRPYNDAGKPKHSGKAREAYDLIEKVSPGPYLELFAREPARDGWSTWGNEAPDGLYLPELAAS
jgi:N6-adenosine-specific RNA methylase IME4